MRQGLRIVTRPSSFFGQLQWSRHHWLIITTFLALAVVETHVGSHQQSHRIIAELLAAQTGWSFSFALGLLTAARLTVLLLAASAGTWVLWWIGNLFGQRSSRRVFFRRLAIVATVVLAGYTLRYFTDVSPTLEYAGWAVCAWGILLGYYAFKEQFGLTRVEAIVMGTFALVAAISSWQLSQDFVEQSVRQHLAHHASSRTHHPEYR